jgi:hypothetical protein
MSADAAALAALWQGATELMLGADGDGSTVCLRPGAAAAADPPLPAALRENVLFALTAFDPPGVQRTRAENAAENGRLYARLLERTAANAPRFVCRGAGVELEAGDGWREDGFVLGWAPGAAADEARAAVLEVAKEFAQGAVYEYRCDDGRGIVRSTVGAAMAMAVVETPMRRVPFDATLASSSPLYELEWAGPDAFTVDALLGDWRGFVTQLHAKLAAAGIDAIERGYEMDHLCYRTGAAEQCVEKACCCCCCCY